MNRKVIPLKKPGEAVYTQMEKNRLQLQLKASGDQSHRQLSDYLKEEKERVRTVALLIEVAETICREQEQIDDDPSP